MKSSFFWLMLSLPTLVLADPCSNIHTDSLKALISAVMAANLEPGSDKAVEWVGKNANDYATARTLLAKPLDGPGLLDQNGQQQELGYNSLLYIIANDYLDEAETTRLKNLNLRIAEGQKSVSDQNQDRMRILTENIDSANEQIDKLYKVRKTLEQNRNSMCQAVATKCGFIPKELMKSDHKRIKSCVEMTVASHQSFLKSVQQECAVKGISQKDKLALNSRCVQDKVLGEAKIEEDRTRRSSNPAGQH